MLLDNIHLDTEYGTTYHYEEVENPDAVSPDSEGRSYILYTEPFIDQIDSLHNNLKYKNGYTSDSQIISNQIRTEQEFKDFWARMEPGNKSYIDNVVIVMHGNYYALIIDAALNDDNTEYLSERIPQNLTVCKKGKVGTDYDATYIGELKRQTIQEINLYSCNVGLLDAINVEKEKSLAEVTGHLSEEYMIEGNVAQAFLRSQNVGKVTAYDGSLSFNDETGWPRLSYTQGHYSNWLDELASERKIVPYRNSSTLPAEYIGNTLINDGINLAGRKGIMPNGEVIYHGNEAEYKYMEYVQEAVDSTGIPYTIIVPYKFEVIVDMKENSQTITNNHSVVA